MVTIGNRLWIWNWWMGSTCIVSLPSRAKAHVNYFRSLQSRSSKPGLATTPAERITLRTPAAKPSREKHNQPPRRDTEPAVDKPAEAGTDEHACNQFAREPKAPGIARCSRRPISRRIVGSLGPARWRARPSPSRWSLAERAASSVCGLSRSPFSRVPSLMLSTLAACTAIATGPPPEAARTILSGFCQVKKRAIDDNHLKSTRRYWPVSARH